MVSSRNGEIFQNGTMKDFEKYTNIYRLAEYAIVGSVFCIMLLLIRMQDINMKILEKEIQLKSTEPQKSEKKVNVELADLYKHYKKSGQVRLPWVHV